MGKEGEYRDSMVRRWSALPEREKLLLAGLASPNDAEAKVAAPIAHPLSTGAAEDMSGLDRSLFTMQTNRRVSRHAGWLSVLIRRKMLRAHPRGKIKVMGYKKARPSEPPKSPSESHRNP